MKRRSGLCALLAGLFLFACLGCSAMAGPGGRAAPVLGLCAGERLQAGQALPPATSSPSSPAASVEAQTRPESFSSPEDYARAWRWQLGSLRLSETYETTESCTAEVLEARLEEIKRAYYPAIWTNLEEACFFPAWEVEVRYQTDAAGLCHNPAFTLTLRPAEGLDGGEAERRLTEFRAACEELMAELLAEGQLSPEQSDKEKARSLYIYLAQALRYDESGQYVTGYDAVTHKTANCQGYTALYNALCKLAGLPMECMTGSAGGAPHAWSRIFADGAWRNIDCTWGDPLPDRPGFWDETWFWRSDAWMKNAEPGRSFDADGFEQ